MIRTLAATCVAVVLSAASTYAQSELHRTNGRNLEDMGDIVRQGFPRPAAPGFIRNIRQN